MGGLSGQFGHEGIGIAAMRFSEQSTADSSRASIADGFKSWFFLDDEYVALGSDIDARPAPEPVFTTVQQSWYSGRPARVFDGNTVQAWSPSQAEVRVAPHWVEHDDVGYVFVPPERGGVASDVWTRTARRESFIHPSHDSATRAPMELFTLWLDHGVGNPDAGYAYIVVPGATGTDGEVAATLGRYLEPGAPVQVTRRDDKAHVVWSQSHTTLMAVIWEAGAGGGLLDLAPGLAVSASDPILLTYSHRGHYVELSVADPAQRLSEVELVLNRELVPGGVVTNCFATLCAVRLPLPQGDQAGSSSTFWIPAKGEG